MRERPSTDQPATQQASSPVTYEPPRNVDARFTMCRPGVRRSSAADHSHRVLVGVKTRRFAPPPHGGADGLDADSARACKAAMGERQDSVGIQMGGSDSLVVATSNGSDAVRRAPRYQRECDCATVPDEARAPKRGSASWRLPGALSSHMDRPAGSGAHGETDTADGQCQETDTS